MVRLGLVVVGLLVLVTVLVAPVGPRGAVAQESLSISGHTWWDENGDGVRQPEDFAIRSTVVLHGPNGLRRVMRLDIDGFFNFEGLAPGDYLLDASGFARTHVMTSPRLKVDAPFAEGVHLTDASATIEFGFHLPQRLPTFGGTAFVNAALATGEVRAWIDDVDCTGPAFVQPPNHGLPRYWFSVFSSEWKPGCGDDGDPITFTVDGLVANETAVWMTPAIANAVDREQRDSILTVGPPFAMYWVLVTDGEVDGFPHPAPVRTLVALIDGQVCSVGQPYTGSFFVIVLPEALKPGCGREGAEVSFAADGFAVEGAVAWRPEVKPHDDGLVFEISESRLSGPAYSYFTLNLPSIPDGYIGHRSHSIEAVIGGKACGYTGGDGPGPVLLAVSPREIEAGCGAPGMKVELLLQGKHLADVVWQAGFHDGPVVPDLNTHLYGSPDSGPFGVLPGTERSTESQILPPSVGDGGLR